MNTARREIIRANLDKVKTQIEEAARSVGREPAQVRLLVVTKSHTVEAVRDAIAAGVQVIGENYAEEAITKMTAVEDMPAVEWHMIGHVQSRKAGLICEHFDWVHSLDSLRLAQRLDRFAGEFRRRLPVLLECNVSGESTKFGFPVWKEENWANCVPDISAILELPHLEVMGLMTIAPFFEKAEPARPFFRRLSRLRDFLAEKFPHTKWGELSMGMSGDFRVAIQEGATIVRIGTAIMGPRA